MNDKAEVKKDQIYLSNEEKKYGVNRTITIERTVMAKRVYDKKKELYAVGVSRINKDEHRPDQVGKKRRVFLKVARLLSYQYTMIATGEPAPEGTSIPVPHVHNPANVGHGHVTKRPDGHVARCGGPAICGICAVEKREAEKPTGELHIETVPGL